MLSSKKTLLKWCLILLVMIILSSSIILSLLLNQSSKSKEAFNNFMSSYISKDIKEANNYVFNTKIPDIQSSFSNAISIQVDESKREIISSLEELMFSIEYEILQSRTLFNTSTIKVKFTYYDIAKHILNFFKNSLYNSENSYMEFLNSLKSTKYLISINVDVELRKINNEWTVVISDKLLNILTAGIYKNFII